MNWLGAFFEGNEDRVDSVIACSAIALLVLIGLSVFATIEAPGTWSPVAFGGGATAIIGALGGSKRIRDWVKRDGDVDTQPRP